VYGLGLMARAGVITPSFYSDYRTKLKETFNTYIRHRTNSDDDDEYASLDQAIKAAYDEFRLEAESTPGVILDFFEH